MQAEESCVKLATIRLEASRLVFKIKVYFFGVILERIKVFYTAM